MSQIEQPKDESGFGDLCKQFQIDHTKTQNSRDLRIVNLFVELIRNHPDVVLDDETILDMIKAREAQRE